MYDILAVARRILDSRHPHAVVAYAAGSILRGEGTAHSDLDLVVVYPSLPAAYRESFRHDDLPVETFVHDPETLLYFFTEVDRPSGVPSLPTMVSEGAELPGQTELSQSLKALANRVLADGPPPLPQSQQDRLRYAITDLSDDLRDPRSYAELIATATDLYEAIANYYLRSRGLWSGRGKALPRRLREVSADFARQYELAFERLFKTGNAGPVLAIAEEILRPDGGWLFDGYKLVAPDTWRRVTSQL